MAALLAIALVANALMKPVDAKHHMAGVARPRRGDDPRCEPSTARAARVRSASAAALCACSRNDGARASRAPRRAPPLITLDTHVDIPLDFATRRRRSADGGPAGQPREDGARRPRRGVLHRLRRPNRAQRRELRASAGRRADEVRRDPPHGRGAVSRAGSRSRIAPTTSSGSRRRGKLVAAIGIENGYVLGQDLELLDRDYELGARYVTLVHDGDNDLARSARPKPELGDGTVDTGVTALGARAIARMNRLGIMVDVSHGSKQTALDAMRLSRAPVIASHSGVGGVDRASAQHGRRDAARAARRRRRDPGRRVRRVPEARSPTSKSPRCARCARASASTGAAAAAR